MASQQPVSIGWQTVFMFLPYVWIYAFYRIEKLRMGLLFALISIGINTGIQMVLPFPYSLGLSLVVTILLPVRFIRKWSREWNSKFTQKNDSEGKEESL